jgi:hypothetical protein
VTFTITTSEGRQVECQDNGQLYTIVPLMEVTHWEYCDILKREIPIHDRETYMRTNDGWVLL